MSTSTTLPSRISAAHRAARLALKKASDEAHAEAQRWRCAKTALGAFQTERWQAVHTACQTALLKLDDVV